MKDVRQVLLLSLSSCLLAIAASGPVSAASFALSDDTRLENVSTLQEIEQTNVIRANYIAQLPSFLQPLLDAETPDSDEDSQPKSQIELWLAGFSTERFSVRLEDLWIIDDASPRIRWFDVKPSNKELAFEAADAPVVTANLTFAESHGSGDMEVLSPFVISAKDTTCGFPDDLLEIEPSFSARLGDIWALTATFAPHAFGGPHIPPMRDVTWLQISQPEFKWQVKMQAEPFNAPWAFLNYGDLPSPESAITLGFSHEPEVFKCRVFASALETPLLTPFPPSYFASQGFGGFPPFVIPVNPTTVPLPGTGGSLAMGLFALAAWRRGKRTKANA